MKKRLLLLWAFLLVNFILCAQQFNKAANDAYIITRMAEKLHVQPKPLNDSFSVDVFTLLTKQLDPENIFFTEGDMKAISKFKYDIDDEIRNRKTDFLVTLTAISKKRIATIDTMINTICKTPFNFSLPEKISASEFGSRPADEKQLRTRLYKFIKASVLDKIMDNDNLFTLSSLQQKKYADSIEPSIRRKVQNSFRHSFESNFESAGGIEEAVGTEYCKAIASSYDPHTEFFPLTEKENFESELGQQSMAFGFQFKEDNDGSVKIDKVTPGSPAFKSGQINKGDKIISIQWENQEPIDVSNGGLQQLYDVLEMSNHDKATMKTQKPDGTVRTVVLYKERSEADDDNKVKSFLLKGKKTIGFISLPAFYQDWENVNTGINGCANDVAKEILKLKRENIQGLILDLRYNGGGSVQEATELAGIFIDAGPVAEYKSRDSKIFTLKDINRGSMYDGPLMVMVNGYSASASEMVAGALQDYHRAVIVGSPTYGKATAQVVLPMDTTITFDSDISDIKTDNYLKLTTSLLYRVTGQTAQAKGVQPDILLPDVLDIDPKREANEPFALISPPIEPNKYFKPLPPLALDNLKTAAKNEMDTSLFFRALKKYTEAEKAAMANTEINLRLADAIQSAMKAKQEITEEDDAEKGTPPYTVENNLYEKQQLQGNERLKEMNEQWITFLIRDPYLRVAYDLIALMK